MTASRERGRPARTKPGTASAISPTRTDRQRRRGSIFFYEHRCTGCTGCTGREVAAPEAGSGGDPVRACGCSGLQASRFLKKSCASCASMLVIPVNHEARGRPPHRLDRPGSAGVPPAPCYLWWSLSFRAALQAATTSAVTATARPKESLGAAAGRSRWRGCPRPCQSFAGGTPALPGCSLPLVGYFPPRCLSWWPFTDPFMRFPTPWSPFADNSFLPLPNPWRIPRDSFPTS